MRDRYLLDIHEVAAHVGVSVRRLKKLRRDRRQEFPDPERRSPLGWKEFDIRRWIGMFVGDIAGFLDSGKGSPPWWWLKRYAKQHFRKLGSYKRNAYYERMQIIKPSVEKTLYEAYRREEEREEALDAERERRAAERKRRRIARTDRALRKLGIVVTPETPRLFWPAADPRLTRRLKRLAGEHATNVLVDDGFYTRTAGVEVPRPCLEAIMKEDLKHDVTALDLLAALLRQAFYLNRRCRKGYGCGSLSDKGRYARKDMCLEEACSLAAEVTGLSWGWNCAQGEELGEFGENESGNPILLNPYPYILYFDLPVGQVSFHTGRRYSGPKYEGKWSGVHLDFFPGDNGVPAWFLKGIKTSAVLKAVG